MHPDHEHHPDEPDEADSAAAAFGIRIEGDRPADTAVDVFLWPECVEAWGVWLGLQSQWALAPSGHRCGLRHEAVLADLRVMGYGPGKRRSLRRIHGEIMAMERAALRAWAEELERERMRKKSHG
jgi:hypothetical protein